MSSRIRNIINGTYFVIFSLCIGAPLILLILGIPSEKVDIGENRRLAASPDFSEATPQKIEQYFSDHLPFRTHFTSKYMEIWEDGLSAYVRRNVKGKQGHFYPNMPSAPVVEYYLGLQPLSVEQLYAIKGYFYGMQAFWVSQQTRYLCAFIPDKPTLYPEYLPSWVSQKHSWSDQVQPLLKNSSLNYLDFTETLIKHKTQGLLYNKKYDIAHWNGLALAVAYNELVARLKLPSAAITPFRLVAKTPEVPFLGEDTVPWMSLNKRYLSLSSASLSTETNEHETEKIINSYEGIGNKHLLLLIDSYLRYTHQDGFPNAYGAIFPLAHNFGVTSYQHRGFINFSNLVQKIEKDKPDYVVETFSERTLAELERYHLPSYILIAGERLADDGYLEINNKTKLKPHNASLSTAEFITVMAHTNDPQLELPPQRTNENGRLVVMLTMYSQVDTACQLFYSFDENGYTAENSVTRKVVKGLNFLHLPIYTKKNSVIRLRLDPGKFKGVYEIFPPSNSEELIRKGLKNGF